MLGRLEDKTAVVAMSELTVNTDRAEFVGKNSAHNRDHTPGRG